jgi:ubiquinone/menaquinone biosynthesis C-methylase UbiE
VTRSLGLSRPPAVVAFDRIAADYDTLTGGEIFSLQRARTHRAFARCFSRESRVLEIGCGTGADTRFLAAHCGQVIACDPSEDMVACSLRKVTREHLEQRVILLPCGLQDLQSYLDALTPQGQFDGVISNFGALNCVEHLAPLGALVRRHLKPGGLALFGLMTRLCAVEALYFTIKRRPALATRRWGGRGRRVAVAGVQVPTFFHRIRDVRRALGPEMRLVAVEGLGVAIPPPFLEPRWRALPRGVRSAAAAVDELVAAWPPFNRLGDHVLLQFAKAAGDA